MKIQNCFMLLAGTVFAMAASQPARALECDPANSGYNFLCRGKISTKTTVGQYYANVFVLFETNTTKSGPFGEYLQPGKCAWQDRPVRSDEPQTGMINQPSDGNMLTLQRVADCLSDQTCILDVCAKNYQTGVLVFDASAVQTYYKK